MKTESISIQGIYKRWGFIFAPAATIASSAAFANGLRRISWIKSSATPYEIILSSALYECAIALSNKFAHTRSFRARTIINLTALVTGALAAPYLARIFFRQTAVALTRDTALKIAAIHLLTKIALYAGLQIGKKTSNYFKAEEDKLYENIAALPTELIDNILRLVLHEKRGNACEQHYKGFTSLTAHFDDSTPEDLISSFYNKQVLEEHVPFPLPDELFEDTSKLQARFYHLIEAFTGLKTPVQFEAMSYDELKLSSGHEELNTAFSATKSFPNDLTFKDLLDHKLEGIILKKLKGNSFLNLREFLSAQSSSFHLAAFKGDLATINSSIATPSSKKALLNQKIVKGLTPLHLAVLGMKFSAVQTLIQSGALVNIRDDDYHQTPLHFAAKRGYVDILKELIQNGASIDIQDEAGKTPLHLAALNGHQNIIKELIENGASIDKQDDLGWSALHFASRYGRIYALRMLLQLKASIDIQNNSGLTPLHLAAYKGNGYAVLELIQGGAFLHAKDKIGYTPLEYASLHERDQNCAEVIRILQHHART